MLSLFFFIGVQQDKNILPLSFSNRKKKNILKVRK